MKPEMVSAVDYDPTNFVKVKHAKLTSDHRNKNEIMIDNVDMDMDINNSDGSACIDDDMTICINNKSSVKKTIIF